MYYLLSREHSTKFKRDYDVEGALSSSGRKSDLMIDHLVPASKVLQGLGGTTSSVHSHKHGSGRKNFDTKNEYYQLQDYFKLNKEEGESGHFFGKEFLH